MVQERIYNYFERNPQLHVLFIFDKLNINYTELEFAEWKDNYIYKVFDGAWFNIKYAIENTWKDKNVVLLFTDGTYPHTEEQMLKFPLLDMLKANMEFKEDDYESFMQQYNLPEKFRLFIKNNVSEMQSTKISTMLTGHLTPETFSEDLVCRAFISSYLGEKKLLDWEPIIVRMLVLGMQSEEKKRNDFFHRLSKNMDAKKAVDAKLKRLFDRTYNPNSEQKIKEVAECLKYNSITQLLDVAQGDNYKQYKIKNPMMLEGQNKVYEYGLQNRQWSEKFGQAMAELGKDIKEEEIISVYGIDAQYNYMPEALCWPILKEILEKQDMSEWVNSILAFNSNGIKVRVLRSSSETDLFRQGQNEYVDKVVSGQGEYKPMNGFPYVNVVGRVLKQPDSISDVAAEVSEEYQKYLENEWIKRLKSKYKYKINKKALKKVK